MIHDPEKTSAGGSHLSTTFTAAPAAEPYTPPRDPPPYTQHHSRTTSNSSTSSSAPLTRNCNTYAPPPTPRLFQLSNLTAPRLPQLYLSLRLLSALLCALALTAAAHARSSYTATASLTLLYGGAAIWPDDALDLAPTTLAIATSAMAGTLSILAVAAGVWRRKVGALDIATGALVLCLAATAAAVGGVLSGEDTLRGYSCAHRGVHHPQIDLGNVCWAAEAAWGVGVAVVCVEVLALAVVGVGRGRGSWGGGAV
ncbi:hypothetical protein EDC01DRAFT_784957 [Geopyxis carbonaria]|nr:hypothetical protein EDC01DRAFT_784957 [Geopyxis carbonaria]